MTRRRTIRLALFLWLATAVAAPAHDFWILPSTFTPAAGDRMTLALRVGDDWPGEALPRDPAHLRAFAAIAPDGRRLDVPGVDGLDPAGILVADRPGAWIVLYRSAETPVELDAGRFESYLAEEGLEWAIARRAERGEAAAPGRELFSRSVKTLLLALPGDDDRSGDPPVDLAPWSRPADLPFELVPEASPCGTGDAEAPAEIALRALAGGEPVAGVRIDLRAVGSGAGSDPEPVATVTGDDGRVALPLPPGTTFLAAAVRLEETPEAAEADWRSTWTSLLFSCR